MQREIKIRLGPTGSGKTFGANQFIQFASPARVLIADAGFNEFGAINFEEYPELLQYLDSISAFQNNSTPFRIAYSPRYGEEPLIFETAQELGNCWLILEEADRFGNPRDCWQYGEVITRGRHRLIHIMALALRPFSLSIDLRAQATSIISYRQIDANDVKWLRELVGDVALELPNLPGPPGAPPFPYLEWDSANGARIVNP